MPVTVKTFANSGEAASALSSTGKIRSSSSTRRRWLWSGRQTNTSKQRSGGNCSKSKSRKIGRSRTIRPMVLDSASAISPSAAEISIIVKIKALCLSIWRGIAALPLAQDGLWQRLIDPQHLAFEEIDLDI